mmetsp:Transcript_13895/g.30135  ORF Transcript_13895/g.30135 Transcript_13895/m.30135 type:complete len:90 (-) Transcript_13895:137-406(-)
MLADRHSVLACDGHAYERQAIQRWFEKRLTSPKTGEPLETPALFPNHPLRRLIVEWREAHGVFINARRPTQRARLRRPRVRAAGHSALV